MKKECEIMLEKKIDEVQ